MNILDRILGIFSKRRPTLPSAEQPAETQRVSSEQRLDGLMKMLANTEEQEISCDDVHHLMAEYADLLEQGSHPEELMPLVQQHLEMCHECEEELEMLLDILKSNA